MSLLTSTLILNKINKIEIIQKILFNTQFIREYIILLITMLFWIINKKYSINSNKCLNKWKNYLKNNSYYKIRKNLQQFNNNNRIKKVFFFSLIFL